MSDHVPSWMPSDETLRATAHNCTLYANCYQPDPMEDLRDVIEEAVEKALAEREATHLQDFLGWKEQQEARHRREVLNAQVSSLVRIEALLDSRRGTALQVVRDAIDALRAELAALDAGKEAKP